MAIVAGPFADFCNCTFPLPAFAGARARLLEVAYAAGAHSEVGGVLRIGPDSRGTFKLSEKWGVGAVGVSGAALAAFRSSGFFDELLMTIGEFPHRVTRLDVAVDVDDDGPRSVSRWYRRGKAGTVALTSSCIPSSQVQRIMGAGLVDGRDTGTVYLGSARRDVRAVVYDKRQEILRRAVDGHGQKPDVIALNDPGPLTRYELRFARHVGVTLADVHKPAPVFWHHARSLLAPPGRIEKWRAHAEGFSVPRRDVTAVQQLELLLETSSDVARMVTLAEQMSSRRDVARRFLFQKLRARLLRELPT